MTLEVKDCIGKWVKFTQRDSGHTCGYVDKAYVVGPFQVYLNTKDNPRCRPDTGYMSDDDDEIPDWANYGWFMDGSSYKDLQLLDDLGDL